MLVYDQKKTGKNAGTVNILLKKRGGEAKIVSYMKRVGGF